MKEGLVITSSPSILQLQLQNHFIAVRHVQRVGDVLGEDHCVWRECGVRFARHGGATTPVGGSLQLVVYDEHPREEAVLAADRGGASIGARIRVTERALALTHSRRSHLHGHRCARRGICSVEPSRVFLAWSRLEFLSLSKVQSHNVQNRITLLAVEEGGLAQQTGDRRVIEKGVGGVLRDDLEVDLQGEKRGREDIALGFLGLDQEDEGHVVDDGIDRHDR